MPKELSNDYLRHAPDDTLVGAALWLHHRRVRAEKAKALLAKQPEAGHVETIREQRDARDQALRDRIEKDALDRKPLGMGEVMIGGPLLSIGTLIFNAIEPLTSGVARAIAITIFVGGAAPAAVPVLRHEVANSRMGRLARRAYRRVRSELQDQVDTDFTALTHAPGPADLDADPARLGQQLAAVLDELSTRRDFEQLPGLHAARVNGEYTEALASLAAVAHQREIDPDRAIRSATVGDVSPYDVLRVTAQLGTEPAPDAERVAVTPLDERDRPSGVPAPDHTAGSDLASRTGIDDALATANDARRAALEPSSVDEADTLGLTEPPMVVAPRDLDDAIGTGVDEADTAVIRDDPSRGRGPGSRDAGPGSLA